MAPTERFAAIDVGSNSVRCLIAERGEDGHLTVIDDLKDQPRLARGLAATGRLDPAAMERATAAIKRMTQAAEKRGVGKMALVATSAVRDASNGKEFADAVKREVGVPLEIISGETEARLAFLSVREHFAIVRGRSVVIDIGGGSLEIVLAVGGLVERALTLPLGAVRTTEQFLPPGADVADGVKRLRATARSRLKKLLPAREWAGARIFGSGGTFTNAARIAAARDQGKVPEATHGSELTLGQLERVLEWLTAMKLEERRTVPGLNAERADIIVAGLAVAAETLAHFDGSQVTVSAFGLREGLLLHLARRNGGEPPNELRAIRRFADRCRTDRRHVEQVLKLSRTLFDTLGKRLGCTSADWPLLQAAALLHDVGQLVSYKGHHRHSYHLIMHAETLPFTPEDRTLVGIISRYHRKGVPSKKHEEYGALTRENRARVKRLAALLRVADGLDRGHVAAVGAVRVGRANGALRIEAVPRLAGADLTLELWGAKRKADLLEDLMETKVEIRAAMLGPKKKKQAVRRSEPSEKAKSG
jgi:exopolyphosphatase / guanosine-5'-triphosphate,3'-diphosphate pyrophosphatase